MKRILALAISSAFLMVGSAAWADGCYLCEDGKHVEYEGDDNKKKRDKAKDEYDCKVTGTRSTCNKSKTKGKVSSYDEDIRGDEDIAWCLAPFSK